MANGVFDIARGRVNELVERIISSDPGTARLQVRLLTITGIEADATLETHATWADVVAASNTEADFTNYVTKTLGAGDLSRAAGKPSTSTVVNDQIWTAAGGATNNTLAKLVICYDAAGTDVDANLIPLTHHDFSATTDGNDLIADFGATFFSAA